MICKDVKEMIPLYYYRELESDQTNAVRAHLASCADCRKELDLVGRVLGKVAVPEAPELPEEFWSRGAADIMRRVRRSRLAIPLWSAAAATAAAVILGLFIIRMIPGPDSDTAAVRSVVSVSDDTAGETELEIESLAVEIDGFWDSALAETSDEVSDGFDSEFARNLEFIEVSIEDILMEFEAADPRRIDVNGSV